jgi:ABC-type sugar transport system, permease component
MSVKKRSLLGKVGLYLFFVLVALFFLFPIIWTVSLSFKTVQELYRIPPSLLPDKFLFNNYQYVIVQVNLLTGLLNSIKITFFTILGTLAISIPAAYCFSRMKFRFSEQLQFIILLFQMVSPLVVVIPMYKYFTALHLLNSHVGVICIYIATSAPFQVWFLKSFIDTIPKELDEAATIDGCTRLQTVSKVILPVIMPGVFSALLLIFIASWSQFVVPYILIDTPSKMPIAAMLVNLQSTLSQITTHYLAAACILAILPTGVLFVFLQKYIVSALTAGAVKG